MGVVECHVHDCSGEVDASSNQPQATENEAVVADLHLTTLPFPPPRPACACARGHTTNRGRLCGPTGPHRVSLQSHLGDWETRTAGEGYRRDVRLVGKSLDKSTQAPGESWCHSVNRRGGPVPSPTRASRLPRAQSPRGRPRTRLTQGTRSGCHRPSVRRER